VQAQSGLRQRIKESGDAGGALAPAHTPNPDERERRQRHASVLVGLGVVEIMEIRKICRVRAVPLVSWCSAKKTSPHNETTPLHEGTAEGAEQADDAGRPASRRTGC
jgi:hypothetical protein